MIGDLIVAVAIFLFMMSTIFCIGYGVVQIARSAQKNVFSVNELQRTNPMLAAWIAHACKDDMTNKRTNAGLADLRCRLLRDNDVSSYKALYKWAESADCVDHWMQNDATFLSNVSADKLGPVMCFIGAHVKRRPIQVFKVLVTASSLLCEPPVLAAFIERFREDPLGHADTANACIQQYVAEQEYERLGTLLDVYDEMCELRNPIRAMDWQRAVFSLDVQLTTLLLQRIPDLPAVIDVAAVVRRYKFYSPAPSQQAMEHFARAMNGAVPRVQWQVDGVAVVQG